MTGLSGTDDTIVALASGRGAAGVAVIRLSGPKAHGVVEAVFRPKNSRHGDVSQWPAGRLLFGSVVDDGGEVIDDCMAMVMRQPHSFTGEDVAEIQCHGSPAVVGAIVEVCLAAGARPAEPGEFSRRAFLNNKMDLAQAEALSDLIAANSEVARRLALHQLRGGLSARLREINSTLVDAAAEIEAHIDFPEEDIPEMARDKILERIQTGIEGMERLLAGHAKARLKQEGARVILAGEPNAGKSSLFNALVGRERAIVSPHPGTTRDTLEATVDINGLAVTLIDTAGIREDAGEIERIGIERAREEIRQADIILHLLEWTCDETPRWPELDGADVSRVVRVWTKRDDVKPEREATPANIPPSDYLEVSAATGAGLSQLERVLYSELTDAAGGDEGDALMSRVRHAENLRLAAASASRALQTFAAGESGDLVMVDLREALSYLGEVLGERLDEQILDRIFSTFCLGK